METLEYTLESEQQFWDGNYTADFPHGARLLTFHDFRARRYSVCEVSLPSIDR
jgi:hypothetical protein